MDIPTHEGYIYLVKLCKIPWNCMNSNMFVLKTKTLQKYSNIILMNTKIIIIIISLSLDLNY